MNEADFASDAAAPQPQRQVRRDWRTGQPSMQHDQAFWNAHEQHRLAQGLSVPQYCAAHGLAMSTFRHRVYGRARASARPQEANAKPAKQPGFVPVTPTQPALVEAVEVVLQGVTLRLHGEAAARLLDSVTAGVMARLA